MISNRLSNIKKSSISMFNRDVEKRSHNITFIKANIGQPDILTDKLYYEALENFSSNKINQYIDALGLPELRSEMASYYNRTNNTNLNKDNIVITQGASDAIIKTLYSICDKGDEILILEPFFVDYKIYADIAEINIKSLSFDKINKEELNKVINDKTKAILFSNPNNPDGYILKESDIKTLVDVSLEKDIFIISDEVYSGLTFSDNYLSFSSYMNEKVIVVDSASKKFNSCGSRIGFIISTNSKLIKSIETLNDSRVSISFSEQFAISKLVNTAEEIIENNKAIYKKRKEALCKCLDKANIKYIEPNGGMALLIDLPVDDAVLYMGWVVNNYEHNGKSFLATPANEFYNNDDNKTKLRISFTFDESKVEELVFMIADSCELYNKINANNEEHVCN